MTKVIIKELKGSKKVNTRFGEKEVWAFISEDGRYFSCWSDLSQNKVGDELDGEETQREYNGKIYWTLKMSRPGFDPNALAQINGKLDKIIELLKVEDTPQEPPQEIF